MDGGVTPEPGAAVAGLHFAKTSPRMRAWNNVR